MSCPIKKAMEDDLMKARATARPGGVMARGDFRRSSSTSESSVNPNSKKNSTSSNSISNDAGTSSITNSLPSSPGRSSSSGDVPSKRRISPASSNPGVNIKSSPPHANPAKCYTIQEDSRAKGGDDSSEPSNYGSGEGSPRRRKASTLSTTSSFASEQDSETSGEQKVDVKSLIEGVGTVIIPA
ncbi:unnamed protein product, partial [Candidula unifasciata]